MPLQKWVIVGGEDRGGILVRAGQELASAKVQDRLSTGAVVEELALVGERMHFRRLTGTGPQEGWISVFLDHKDLAQRLPASSAEGTTPQRSSPAAPSPATSAPPPPRPSSTENAADSSAFAATGAAPLALTDAGLTGDQSADAPPGQQADAGGQGGASGADGEQSWHEEAGDSRPPPRFEASPASKLPPDVSDDLKWLVWNEIWRVVNNKLGSLTESEEKRKFHFNAAEQDEGRSCKHLRQALGSNVFSNSTILQVKRQASQGGHAVATGFTKGIWLVAARCEALETPKEMEYMLWIGIVKAIRTASVTIFFQAKQDKDKAWGFEQDFALAWKEIVEYTPPDPY